jgi:hypothetical protein
MSMARPRLPGTENARVPTTKFRPSQKDADTEAGQGTVVQMKTGSQTQGPAFFDNDP